MVVKPESLKAHRELAEKVFDEFALAASLVFGAALGGFLGVVFATADAFKEGNEFLIATALTRFSLSVAVIFLLRRLNIWDHKWWYLGMVIFCVWAYRGGVVTLYWAGFDVAPIHVIFLSWIVMIVTISILEILTLRVVKKKLEAKSSND